MLFKNHYGFNVEINKTSRWSNTYIWAAKRDLRVWSRNGAEIPTIYTTRLENYITITGSTAINDHRITRPINTLHPGTR